MLDVEEAEMLLKQTLAEWDITTEWVTREWVMQQFRAVTGEGDADKRGMPQLTVDEFQMFCSNFMNFICHLGAVMENEEAPPAAAEPPAAAPTDESPAEAEASKKGGCCVIL